MESGLVSTEPDPTKDGLVWAPGSRDNCRLPEKQANVMSEQPPYDSTGRSGRQGGKQVRLAIFNNEPMVRLAEQRLRQAGIPCLSRALRGGPGLWGSSYNLPHDLYVHQGDEMQAREVLDLAPQEIEERERQAAPSSGMGLGLAAALIIAAVLVLATVVPIVVRL